MRLSALSRGIALAALGALPMAALACKGGASAAGASQVQGGQQNAAAGAPGATGGGSAVPNQRNRAPDLTHIENSAVIADREYEVRSEFGGMLKFHERLYSDGLGQLRLDLIEVWDAQTQAWIPPHPLIQSLYEPRTFNLVRQRDLHTGHPNALYGNYEWNPQSATVTIAGKSCTHTVARSLRGTGDIHLYHETTTNLLLRWEVLNESGTSALSSLTTTSLNETPDLNQVQWIPDRVLEQEYDPATHDPLLGFTPHSPTAPPAGYYLWKREFVNASQLDAGLPLLYVEHWTDGVRKMILAQHKIPPPLPNQPQGLHTALRSQVGGVAVVEADLYDRHVFGLGGLPLSDLEVVFGSLVQ